jgi:hypothetical protein
MQINTSIAQSDKKGSIPEEKKWVAEKNEGSSIQKTLAVRLHSVLDQIAKVVSTHLLLLGVKRYDILEKTVNATIALLTKLAEQIRAPTQDLQEDVSLLILAHAGHILFQSKNCPDLHHLLPTINNADLLLERNLLQLVTRAACSITMGFGSYFNLIHETMQIILSLLTDIVLQIQAKKEDALEVLAMATHHAIASVESVRMQNIQVSQEFL